MAAKKKSSNKNTNTLNNYNILNMQGAMGVIMLIFILAAFVLVPLNMSSNYTVMESKIRSFIFLIACLGAAILFSFLFLLAQGNKIKLPAFKSILKNIRPYEYAALAYWVVMLLSAILSPFPDVAFKGATARPENFWFQSGYLFIFLCTARFYKPRIKDLLVLISVLTLISIYGTLQFYGYDFFNLHVGAERYGIILFATLSNRNTASVLLTIGFLLGFVFFAQKSKGWHIVFLPLTLIIFYGLILCNTESGYLGVALSLLFMVPLIARDKFCVSRAFLLVSGCLALILVYALEYSFYCKAANAETAATLMLLASILPYLIAVFGIGSFLFYKIKLNKPIMSARQFRIGWPILIISIIALSYLALPSIAAIANYTTLDEFVEITRGNIDDTFMSGRAFVWRRSFILIKQHPLLGVGPDVFARAMKVFEQESIDLLNVFFDKVHSEYIQTLVDTGILGLTSILSVFSLVFFSIRKKMDDTITVALTTAMFCFLVQAIFNFSTPVTHPIVWICWGILASCGYQQNEGQTKML